jgi:hypothetical protein
LKVFVEEKALPSNSKWPQKEQQLINKKSIENTEE